jgi:hypothetical protein
MFRRSLVALVWLALLVAPASAFSPFQVATVTPAWQAPGWAGFVPSSLGSALKAYWDADDHGTGRMTDAGSGVISAWQDQTAGLSLTATTTARPTWASTSFNSIYAGVTCDGSANNLAVSSTTGLVTGTTDGWIFGLLQSVSSGSIGAAFGYGVATASNSRQVSKTAADFSQISDGSAALTDAAHSIVGPHVLAGEWTGSAILGFVDESPNSRSSIAASSNTSTTRTRFCGSQATSPANFYSGVIRTVIVTGALTGFTNGASPRQQLGAWLAWHGGIQANLPWNHPYRNRAP